MKLFLDTSSLIKLYHQEAGTDNIEQVFVSNNVTTVFLSEIAKIEFCSTVWKKVRTQEISEQQAQMMIELFETDLDKYTFIQIDSIVTERARQVISKYGKQGLRTLDSIQLATAIELKNQADLFLTADKMLNTFFTEESLAVK